MVIPISTVKPPKSVRRHSGFAQLHQRLEVQAAVELRATGRPVRRDSAAARVDTVVPRRIIVWHRCVRLGLESVMPSMYNPGFWDTWN